MSISKRAKWMALLAALSVGTALQVGANGCAEYFTTMALSSFDFCSVFNCTGGTFFNFCDPIPLFVNCP
ncbi:MAG: hypothetical protein ABIG44_01095 [Planctomycetota bacterium]